MFTTRVRDDFGILNKKDMIENRRNSIGFDDRIRNNVELDILTWITRHML